MSDLSKLKFNIADPLHLQAMINYCINKGLEKYNTTIQEINNKFGGVIENSYWYEYYSFENPQEYSNWTQFIYKVLRNQTHPKLERQQVNTYAYYIINSNSLRKVWEKKEAETIKFDNQPKEELILETNGEETTIKSESTED